METLIYNKHFLALELTNKRSKDKLSMDEASKQIGTSKATYSRAEKAMMIDIETFAKMCWWLQLAPNDFFYLKPIKQC